MIRSLLAARASSLKIVIVSCHIFKKLPQFLGEKFDVPAGSLKRMTRSRCIARCVAESIAHVLAAFATGSVVSLSTHFAKLFHPIGGFAGFFLLVSLVSLS